MTTPLPSVELRAAYDAKDWASTSLGRREDWPVELQHALDTILHTEFAAVVLWGDELRLIYNDAYVQLIGDKHPAALGEPCKEVFWEAWEQIEPLFDQVRGAGRATMVEDLLLPLHRHGFLEDCYFDFSYSPLHDAQGEVVGVLDITVETTHRVLAQRRLALLARLTASLGIVESRDELRVVAHDVLGRFPDDVLGAELRFAGETAATWVGTPDDGLPDTDEHGRGAVVRQDLRDPATGEVLATLGVRVSDRLPYDEEYRDLLGLVAATLTQALSRLQLREVERRRTDEERDLLVTLQNSLLLPPQSTPTLRVAARYVPAADVAQIGGDWYDAFDQGDGTLVLTVGDIAGHDSAAAATMAQALNLIRGVAYALWERPGRVLEVLDRALQRLTEPAVATALVARVDPPAAADGSEAASGMRTLRWSRAGHPPPVVLAPDGTTSLLDAGGDLLLGVDPDTVRGEESVELAPGSTVVFYTDGLVERRGELLDVGTAALVARLAGGQHLDPEALCDHLLDGLVTEQEDDVALMVLRV
ncbi:SpoIIE family protein phosphatase [Nocardioides zeae]|uniref:SpoIIE family protein phosphatase n=1 Tax=Nocardioides imazamoxiresistens TaxID=3231893 RepID=A0ABU3PW12_9ACTN|nr:SpoIIE family protein phosphatase [Nocardioides zeae]MDT9593418.1 SpoIIE family protein phosphatase [Nocardioides zeae]